MPNGMGLEKAKFIRIDNNKEVKVLFNPSEYKISDSAEYKTTPNGANGAIVSFVGTNNATLDLSVFFDTSARMTMESLYIATDVSMETKKFIHLLYTDGTLHAPPVVKFVWGSLKFKGVIKSIQSNYTMFEKDGMPVRAKLDISMMEKLDVGEKSRKSPFESPDRTKYRLVTADKNLFRLAYEEYGDTGYWRVIAKENGIRTPLDVGVGTLLKIPAL